MPAAPTPRVSVVVPTHGRPALLADCLACLVAQDTHANDYEVIVVDDGSPHGVHLENQRMVMRAQQRRPGLAVRYFWTASNHGPAAARNRGWKAARAPVIAFTDDDTRPAKTWLREGLRALAGGEAVAGRVVVPLPDDPTDYERDAAGLAQASFVTANAFVRREVLDAVGGFDERYRIAWREDADLEFELRRRGASIGRAKAAIVVHPIRPARWGVSLAQQRKVLFDALLYKKHPRAYRSAIRRHPPWHYYAAVAALVAAGVTALAGRWAGTTVALVVWTGITGAFAWKRLRETRKTPSHVLEMLATSALIPPLSVFWRLAGAWRFRTPFL
jgi:GT2 family glycosyltransferase